MTQNANRDGKLVYYSLYCFKKAKTGKCWESCCPCLWRSIILIGLIFSTNYYTSNIGPKGGGTSVGVFLWEPTYARKSKVRCKPQKTPNSWDNSRNWARTHHLPFTSFRVRSSRALVSWELQWSLLGIREMVERMVRPTSTIGLELNKINLLLASQQLLAKFQTFVVISREN